MKPTEQQLQEIYEEAVSAECAEKQGEEMSSFDLLCKLDEAGGLATFIRTMIDTVRATRNQQPTAYLNDAHLGRGHVEGEVGEDGDAPGDDPSLPRAAGLPVYPAILSQSWSVPSWKIIAGA